VERQEPIWRVTAKFLNEAGRVVAAKGWGGSRLSGGTGTATPLRATLFPVPVRVRASASGVWIYPHRSTLFERRCSVRGRDGVIGRPGGFCRVKPPGAGAGWRSGREVEWRAAPTCDLLRRRHAVLRALAEDSRPLPRERGTQARAGQEGKRAGKRAQGERIGAGIGCSWGQRVAPRRKGVAA